MPNRDSLSRPESLQGPLEGFIHKRVALFACSAAADQAAPVMHNGVVDYYELLGVDDDATQGEIKMAYRGIAKECHPDYMGEEGHNICILLNEAYEVLSDPMSRQIYNGSLQTALIDAMDDYTGQPYSKWLVNHKLGKNWDTNEERAVFVDEPSCIGCKQCVWIASGVYRLDPEHGRSRVFAQWANTEDDIQASMDSCPVDCISWVHKDQLPALEYVTRNRTQRNNVANIMSGMGNSVDVFAAARQFIKARERREGDRKKASRRSEMHERARKQAAYDLMQKRGGWVAHFGSYMEAAMNGVARSVDASMDDFDEAPRVGFRKRHVPGSAFDQETGATIPVERALVRQEPRR